MKAEEYLKKLTDQIRCAKARAAIAEEMLGHIDEQKHAYISQGMDALRKRRRPLLRRWEIQWKRVACWIASTGPGWPGE